MKRVLVIDDEKLIVDLIRHVLSMRGFYVETASDGEEGIEKYNGGIFDLVITDLNMPNCNGNQVCEHIRKSKRPATPVIAISGTPQELSTHLFDRFIQKPFSVKTLFGQLQRLFEA